MDEHVALFDAKRLSIGKLLPGHITDGDPGMVAERCQWGCSAHDFRINMGVYFTREASPRLPGRRKIDQNSLIGHETCGSIRTLTVGTGGVESVFTFTPH